MLEAGFICIDHKCSNSVNSVQKSSQQKWVRGEACLGAEKKGESLKIPGCSYVKMPLSVQNFARAIIGTTLIGTSLHFYQHAMQGLFLFQGTQIYNSWKCQKFNMYVLLAARCISLCLCLQAQADSIVNFYCWSHWSKRQQGNGTGRQKQRNRLKIWTIEV